MSNVKFKILPPEHLNRDVDEVRIRIHNNGASGFVSQATFCSTMSKIKGFYLRNIVLKI